ncbi:hypothetical protein JTB14_012969 [Gonioctena quinquepunctata]|nr:hypothetical protein JTB14_012969 [Gonioctena quinquepunctata]
MESEVAVFDMLASIDVNNFVQVEVLVNDETGEMGEVVEQVGGDDEAVESGGVPAAADVLEDLIFYTQKPLHVRTNAQN